MRVSYRFPVFLFFIISAVLADIQSETLHLKNGEVYSGHVTGANESHIILQTKHGRVQIQWNDIRAEELNVLKQKFLKSGDQQRSKGNDSKINKGSSVPLILPVIVKAKAIVGKQGQWDSYYDPDVFDFVQKASVEIDLKNGTRLELKNLRLIYFVFAVADISREQYVAGAGHYDFELHSLESAAYRTDRLFFHGERTAFEYLPNYRAGDKYYGYVVTVWQDNDLVGFYASPRSLQKLKDSAKSLKEDYSKNSGHAEPN